MSLIYCDIAPDGSMSRSNPNGFESTKDDVTTTEAVEIEQRLESVEKSIKEILGKHDVFFHVDQNYNLWIYDELSNTPRRIW